MTRSFQLSAPPDHQRGVVLFVGLVLLLLLTLIGIAAMQVTVLQERMAGNFYAQHLGFEAGEAQLATGRKAIYNDAAAYGTPISLGTGGTLPWSAWVTSEPTTPQVVINSITSGGGGSGGDAFAGGSGTPIGSGVGGGSGDLSYFSVTAIGADASGDAKTALQGIYIFTQASSL